MEENKPQLMEVMGDHIYHPRLADHYGEIYEPLSDEAVRSLNKLLWKLYRREIRVYEFEKQAAELKIPKFQEEIWPGILRYDLMPLADYLGFRIQDYLHHLKAADFKNLKVIDLEDWIAKLNAEKRLGLNVVDQKKVFNILSQYLRGSKNSGEAAELISQPANLGGIGLNPDFAKEIVNIFKSKLGEALSNDEVLTEQKIDPQIIEKLKNKKEEEAFFKSHQQPVTADAGRRPSAVSIQPKGKIIPMAESRVLKADSRISGGLDASVASTKISELAPAIIKYDAEADKIIHQVGLKLVPELEKRLKVVVISQLKDIRKPPEVRERLMSAPAEGGVGLKTEETDKIIKLAESGRKKILQTVPVAPAVIPSLPADEAGQAEGSLSPKQEIPPLAPLGRNDKQIQTPKPIADSRKLTAENRPQPLRPVMQMEDNFAPRTSADIKKSTPQAIKIVPQPENRLKVELTPPPPPVRPPQTVAIPQTPGGKARVEDVVYRPRLMGPMEELKEMSLLDFRRLSPKVKVATDKIFAKIELLGQESYQNKIKGIQAWQGSPVNKLYSAILNESLRQGVTISQVIEEKQKRNEETLKPEEFKAIVELNRSLKV